MVARFITIREKVCKGLQGVGVAHSTGEAGDSITPQAGEGTLLVCTSIGMP